jgi:hypothetical protein
MLLSFSVSCFSLNLNEFLVFEFVIKTAKATKTKTTTMTTISKYQQQKTIMIVA